MTLGISDCRIFWNCLSYQRSVHKYLPLSHISWFLYQEVQERISNWRGRLSQCLIRYKYTSPAMTGKIFSPYNTCFIDCVLVSGSKGWSIDPVKQNVSVQNSHYFLTYQLKLMLWVLKIIVSLRRGFFTTHNICIGWEVRKCLLFSGCLLVLEQRLCHFMVTRLYTSHGMWFPTMNILTSVDSG